MAKKPAGRANPAVNRPMPTRDPYMDGSGSANVPQLTSGLTFRDMGTSGLRQYGGWVREEFLSQLLGRQAARAYREMYDNSPIVGAVMFAINQTMRKVEWRTQGVADTGAAKEAEEFADSLRFDMSHTWDDFITEALSMLIYGFAPHEVVYKRRMGKNPPGGTDPRDPNSQAPSDFDDGRIGIRRLPIRGQDTIIKWFFSINGDILGLTQQPWIGQLVDIPIEKALLFRPAAHKNNPEGRSILRNAYRSYYFIKRLEEQEAVFLERMSGVPVVSIPNQILEAASAPGAPAGAVAALANWKKIATNVRMDEQMGVVIPSNVWGQDGTGEKMFDFRLEVPSGRSQAAFHTAIERHKLDILMSVMCDFISLGHTARGTQNLSLSKVDMFFQAIEGWLNGIAAVLNRHMLPRLWAMNGMDPDLMPEYVPDLAQRIDLDALGNYFLHLSQSGAQLFPDVDLENWARDAAGMPDISDEAAYNASAGASDTTALEKIMKGSIALRLKRERERGPALPIRTRKVDKVPTVYVCRHGSTAYNLGGAGKDKVRGWLDVPLDARGERDAGRLAAELADAPLTAIFCSNLIRGRETAGAIAEDHPQAKLIPNIRLRSWNLGDMQGALVSGDVIGQIKHYVAESAEQPPGGESFDAFVSRFLSYAAEILAHARQADDAVAVVSHARNVQLFELWVRAGHDATSMAEQYGDDLGSEPDTVKPGGFIELQYLRGSWQIVRQFRAETARQTQAVS